jgi:hypothetical protein
MRILLNGVAAVAAVVWLAGCGFENPLTGGATKDMNTWLLGVWEHRNAKGNLVGRVSVTPQAPARYWVVAEKKEKGRTKVYTFDAWISRVGRASFLSLKCVSAPADLAPDTFLFVHYQLLSQNAVRLRLLELASAPDASSYELRKEVRARLKDQTLLAGEGTDWERVSEVYWSGDDAPQPFQPLRFPTAE